MVRMSLHSSDVSSGVSKFQSDEGWSMRDEEGFFPLPSSRADTAMSSEASVSQLVEIASSSSAPRSVALEQMAGTAGI